MAPATGHFATFGRNASSRDAWQPTVPADSREREEGLARSLPRQFGTASPPEARAPDGLTIYAVGDVHGRADLLKLLIEQIRSDRAGTQGRVELIFLGDYIDRGPDSGAVIDQIIELQDDPDFSVTALKGNHESVALQFLADPTVGHFWCGIGGRATLLSYGVRPPVGSCDMEHWEATRRAFEAALPAAHLNFLQRLSTYTERGDYVFVHAGLRPRVRLAEQREWDMLWIRNEFLSHRGPFEKVVVHGHTPEGQPFVGSNRIGIDTGADVTNRLTGLRLAGTERRIISVNEAPVRFPRAAQNMGHAPRPLPARPWLPPSPEIPPVPEPGIATTPWWRSKPALARTTAALPPGLIALVAIGYLAVPPDRSAPETGLPASEQPGAAAPGTNRDIDDILARADKALHAATASLAAHDANIANPTTLVPKDRQTQPAAASTQPVLDPAPKREAEASGTLKPNPAEPASTTAQQLAERRESETRNAAVSTPSPNRTSATTRAATADRATAASPVSRGSRAAEAADRPKGFDSSKDVRLAYGAASAARNALQTANEEVTHNVGAARSIPTEQAVAYTAAAPIKNANRIGPLDYLDSSIRADEQGLVGVRYVIDTSGRVSACNTIQSSSFARLDKRTCELILRRFRFKPAIRNGQPVQEIREQRIRWALAE